MPSADEQLLEIYKGEFAPPTGWDAAAAKAYRRLLNGEKGNGEIARFAPIGQITMGSGIIPDSFPFIQYSGETVDNTELLKRGTLIRNAMNKYDPYSTDAWEPIVLDNGRGDKVSYDKLKFIENLAPEGPRPKDPVVQYLKSLPPTPGPKMRIKSDAKSFQAANYSPDTLFSWTNGEITGNQTMLEIHHAIKRAAGDYLLTLYEEHRNRKFETMKLIDYEILQNLRFGTEGKYVNRYSMKNALAALKQTPKGPKKVLLLLKNQIELEDDDYELFNPVIKVDNKGFQKWRKYADNKRKKYNYFMSVLSKSVVNTDASKPDMKEYKDLNTEADARRAAIAAIQRVKAARAAPATTAGSNAAAIKAQNDAVDQYIKDIKATTNKADLDNLRQPDTGLLGPNKLARDTEMGQAFLAQERIFNPQPPAPPDYGNMSLDEVSQLSDKEIGDDVGMKRLRELLGYDMARGSEQDKNKFTNKEFIELDELVRKAKAKEGFDPAKAAKDRQQYEDSKTYALGTCVQYDGNEVGTIVSLDLDNRKVGVEKYKGDGTAVTKNMDDVSVLTSADCAQLKGNIDFLIQQSVDKREEEEKRKKEEEDRLAAAEQAEQDRLAAEEAKKKAAEETARVAAAKAKAKALAKLPKLTVEDSNSPNWFKLIQGKDIKFYAASGTNKDLESLKDMIDKFPKNDHLIEYRLEEPDDDLPGAWKIFGEQFTIAQDARVTDSLIVTKNYGDVLKDENFKVRESIAPATILKIKNQADKAIQALHGAGIVHQDIKLDNMVWDGTTLTLIDLGDARMLNEACEAQFNGESMNILPPPELGDAKLGDYWSLVVALLNLGGKNLQPVDDVAKGGGSSSISETLFTADAEKAGGCWVLEESSGLLFQEGDRPTVTASRKEHIRNMIKPNKADHGQFLFEYLWFVWNREDDLVKDLSKQNMTGIIPGYGPNPSTFLPGGKNKDNNDYLDLLTARMATSRREIAKQWVQGHLRWNTLQKKLNERNNLWTATKGKIQGNTVTNEFKKSKDGYYKDIGNLYYGIPTTTVVKIFTLLETKADIARKVILPSRTSFMDLDYDSYSDAELDEFEAALEPYDEEELDKLMDGALTGMAKEAYDSSSDGSNAISYDSSSDTGLSGAALSYDSSSDGGGSGAAHSYNSESEQSFHGSEHGASYDSDSDEDS